MLSSSKLVTSYLVAFHLGLILVSGLETGAELDDYDQEVEPKNDPCAIVRCGYGATCRAENGVAKCVCAIACPQYVLPFCASDGKTYGNPCFMRVQACNDKRPLPTEVHKGACTSDDGQKSTTSTPRRLSTKISPGIGVPKPRCPSICPQIYSPFCGSDGKTYGNDCFARVQACKENRPVPTKVHDGECTSDDQQPSSTKAPVPVCRNHKHKHQNHQTVNHNEN